MTDAKRLAKNTFFMYARMILIMLVGIYTSRVVLEKLGVDDYGLYNAVASIVAMVIFLNTSLSTSTSRFLTYDLGKGDMEKMKKTFSTSFYMHSLLAGIVVLLLETAGVWYMGNKFVIPEGREYAVHLVYQILVLATVVSILRVPYTASIMAHEDMNVYAFVGIYDVFARLGIVYLIGVSPIDHLIFYAILIAIVHISVMLIYMVISHRRYEETHLCRHFCGETLKGMLGFTGWTAVANISNTMVVQGAIVLLNLFFTPAIIASKALANQISQAIMQFVSNFRVALNPQIIKSYAADEMADFKKWSLRSTVISCDLLLVLGLPCIITMKSILNIWLVEVPPMAVEFSQIALFSQIIGSIPSSTYIPFVAAGKLKLNAVWGTVSGIFYFVSLYIVFKLGAGALWVQWLNLLVILLFVFWLRPYLLHKEVGFTYKEVFQCIWNCFKPMIVSGIIACIMASFFGESIWQQGFLFLLVFIMTCIVVWLFLEKAIREYIIKMVISKLYRR